MNPELNSVLDAALKLSLEQQDELIQKIMFSRPPRAKTGDVSKYFGTFDSGDPRSADNDKIDADLARAYSDNHELED